MPLVIYGLGSYTYTHKHLRMKLISRNQTRRLQTDTPGLKIIDFKTCIYTVSTL